MAKVLTISKEDSGEVIEKKIKDWTEAAMPPAKAFNAAKYTGKIKSYGDALTYQRKLRNEWD